MGSRPADPTFEPRIVLERLLERDVRLVVVGAFAAEIRGIAGIATRDLDVAPDLSEENLQALAETLHALGATIRLDAHGPGPVRLPSDGRLIARAPILNLHIVGAGDIDVIHAAGATADGEKPLDYEHLAPRATTEPVAGTGLSMLVMSEADWLESKRRPPVREKDRLHIAAYERWRAAR